MERSLPSPIRTAQQCFHSPAPMPSSCGQRIAPRSPLVMRWNLSLSLEIHLVHQRSDEHTSELQSLMRISYAVSCLKKKKRAHVYTPIPHEPTVYTLMTAKTQ